MESRDFQTGVKNKLPKALPDGKSGACDFAAQGEEGISYQKYCQDLKSCFQKRMLEAANQGTGNLMQVFERAQGDMEKLMAESGFNLKTSILIQEDKTAIVGKNGTNQCNMLSITNTLEIILAEQRANFKIVNSGIQAVAEVNSKLRQENEELKQLHNDGFFKFAQKVDKTDFMTFVYILVYGNQKAAADAMGIPKTNLYERVKAWGEKNKDYKRMERAVEWRKKVGRKIMAQLGQALQSGDSGETPENPETLKETLEKIKENEVDSRSYPELLRDILIILQSQNPKNWETVKQKLITILKEEVPE